MDRQRIRALIVELTLTEVVKLIVAPLAGILLGLVGSFAALQNLVTNPFILWPLIAIAALACGAAGLWIAWRFGIADVPHFRRVDAPFRIEESDVVIERTAKNKFRYKKRKVLTARRDGLSYYEDKYRWTGTNARIQSTNKAHKIRDMGTRSVWNFYQIDFQRILNKGDQVETEVVWECEDADEHRVPFVSQTIELPTKKLSLTVIMPKTIDRLQVIYGEVSSHMGSSGLYEHKELRLDDRDTCTEVDPIAGTS